MWNAGFIFSCSFKCYDFTSKSAIRAERRAEWWASEKQMRKLEKEPSSCLFFARYSARYIPVPRVRLHHMNAGNRLFSKNKLLILRFSFQLRMTRVSWLVREISLSMLNTSYYQTQLGYLACIVIPFNSKIEWRGDNGGGYITATSRMSAKLSNSLIETVFLHGRYKVVFISFPH